MPSESTVPNALPTVGPATPARPGSVGGSDETTVPVVVVPSLPVLVVTPPVTPPAAPAAVSVAAPSATAPVTPPTTSPARPEPAVAVPIVPGRSPGTGSVIASTNSSNDPTEPEVSRARAARRAPPSPARPNQQAKPDRWSARVVVPGARAPGQRPRATPPAPTQRLARYGETTHDPRQSAARQHAARQQAMRHQAERTLSARQARARRKTAKRQAELDVRAARQAQVVQAQAAARQARAARQQERARPGRSHPGTVVRARVRRSRARRFVLAVVAVSLIIAVPVVSAYVAYKLTIGENPFSWPPTVEFRTIF
jgi:hypothetical protein